jgi:hypothetical protein
MSNDKNDKPKPPEKPQSQQTVNQTKPELPPPSQHSKVTKSIDVIEKSDKKK